MLPPMRALLVVLAAAACQRSSDPPPSAGSAAGAAPGPSLVATLTRSEAEDLCFAFDRSGAAADVAANRNYLIADWLGKQIVSETGRAWMADFARLGQDKAARRTALERLAKTHALADCPLAAMWQ